MRPLQALRSLGLAALLLTLAAIALVTAFGSASAANLDEVEPNDDPANATLIWPGDYGNGSNAGGETDFWEVVVASPGLLQIAFPYTSCGIARVAWASNNTTAPVAIAQDHSIGAVQVYRIGLATPENMLIELCPGMWSGAYTFNVTLTTDYSGQTGFDEVELNDDVAHATPVPADRYAEGRVVAKWADNDFWRYDPPRSGWVEVGWGGCQFSGGCNVEGWNSTIPLTYYATEMKRYYHLGPGEPLYLRFSIDYQEWNYYFRVRFADDLWSFSAKADDIEPNDDEANAQVVTPGVNLTFKLDAVIDAVDSFRIVGHRGDYISIWVRPTDDSTHYWSINATPLAGSIQFPPDTSPWYSHDSVFASVFLQSDEDIVFSIRMLSYWTAELKVIVMLTHHDVLDDGNLTLPELLTVLGAGYQGYDLQPRWAGYTAPQEGVNLTNGFAYLFGPSMCMVLYGVNNNLAGVIVEQGQVFRTPSGYFGTVATQDAVLTLHPSLGSWDYETVCFNAMAVDYSSPPWGYGERFVGAEKLEGNLSLVLDEIATREADNESGQLALWSTALFMNETGARDQGATDHDLFWARDILRAVGVQTCLNGLVDPRCSGIYWPPLPLPSDACDPINVTRPAERPSDNESANITGPGGSTGGAFGGALPSLGAAEGAVVGAVAGAAVAGAVAFVLLTSGGASPRVPKRRP